MIVKIVVQLCIICVGSAESPVVSLQDLRLFLLQLRNLRLHVPLPVYTIKKNGEQKHHGQNDPCPYLIFIQRKDMLLGQSDRSEKAKKRNC